MLRQLVNISGQFEQLNPSLYHSAVLYAFLQRLANDQLPSMSRMASATPDLTLPFQLTLALIAPTHE